MKAQGWSDPTGVDRMTAGEAAYASVSLLVEERLRAATAAHRAVDRTRHRTLRTRAGMAIVAVGRRVGGRGLERSGADARASGALPRRVGAGRAG